MYAALAASVVLMVTLDPHPALSADMSAQYRSALESCVAKSLSQMDDGITPANVVGKILTDMCRDENRSLYTQAMEGRSRAYASGYHRAAERYFTGYVLFNRAAHKSTTK